MEQIEMEYYKLLCDAHDLITDLKRCGTFYNSAIELDRYIDNSIDGEKFEERIDILLKKIEKSIK